MSGQIELNQQGRPVCRRLADEVGETVNIAVLDGPSAVNIDQVLGRSSITTHNWVGQRTPLHATSSGKVLLAHLPEDRVTALIGEGLDASTPRTVTDPPVLRDQLAQGGRRRLRVHRRRARTRAERRRRPDPRPRRPGHRGGQRVRALVPPAGGADPRGRRAGDRGGHGDLVPDGASTRLIPG
jgi:hypothetical protein